MAFQFPWTNLHELNLDWFLSKFKQFTNNFLETTATAESVPYGTQPTVTVTGGELDDDTDIVDPFTFNFKIPAGQDGFSPTATVTKSGDVATITITDKNGTTTATVTDGTTLPDGSVSFNKFNAELKEQINRTMFNDLYNAKYIGHKGLNGWITGTTSKPVVQSNSLMALDFAKTMGIKFVETDTTILSDGTWVISHDLTTDNMSGTLANLIDIDITEFKSRKVIKEYLTNGAYWTYSADEQYTPITLEEYLLRAKELGLYVFPEVKYLNAGFTNQNWIDFGDTVKRCGMENSIVIYTAYTAYMRGMYAQLPNTPVCNSAIKAVNADEIVAELSNYPYKFALTGESDYTYALGKCKDANIPLGLWVIDDPETAKTFIANGGTFVATGILTNSISEDGLFLYNTYGVSEFYKKSADYAQGGTASYSDGIIALATDAYRQRYLHNIPVSSGDILEFSAYVKTSGVGEGQLFINNTQSSLNKRQLLKKSTSTEWEKVTIIYVAGKDDTLVDIAINNRNMTGTSSTIYFKDIVIKHYNRKDQADWIALDHVSYAKQGKVVTITRDSNISITASTWTTVDTLPPDARPPRTLEYPISMGGTGTVLGILKVDIYGTISIYCTSAQNVQYYTISYII